METAAAAALDRPRGCGKLLSRMRSQLTTRRQRKTNASIYPRASLLGLPYELLLDITDYLDLGDKACLSLCNRLLRNKMNSPPSALFRVMNGSDDQRRDFLLQLARGRPGLFYCYACRELQLASTSARTSICRDIIARVTLCGAR